MTTEQDEEDRTRREREAETILVRNVVTSIAEPLAKAFKGMSEMGLLTTRYQLYTDACNAILNGGHVITFRFHTCKIPDLLDHIWRTT